MITVTFSQSPRGWQGVIQDDNGYRVAVTRQNNHPSPESAALALLTEQLAWFGVTTLRLQSITQPKPVIDHDHLSTEAITPPPRQ
jgi:hypothetical protein